MKSLKIPKWQSGAVNGRTDTTVMKRKRTKRQTYDIKYTTQTSKE
jgi:hypothetical protein